MESNQDAQGFQGRLPPQNLEAEMSVLASVMLSPHSLDEISFLRVDHFYADRHQRIFETIRTLYQNQIGIDAVTVAESLNTQVRLEEVGGTEYLAKVLETVPNSAHAVFYANIVVDLWLKRSVLYTCTELCTMVYDHSGPAREILEQAEARVLAISEHETSSDVESFNDVVLQAWAALEERIGNQQTISGLATEWTQLDEQLSGLQPGNMVIVGARPSMGKTAFACGMILGASQHGTALVFSLEQSKHEMIERCLATQAGVDGHRLRNGQVSVVERDLLMAATHELSGRQIFIDDKPGRKVFEISSIARRVRRRHGLALIVIDYLQLIEPEDSRAPREQQVAVTSRRLKALARELQVPIVVLAQLNREVENRPDKKPRLSDLRESGSIEQDADVVLLLHRPAAYDPDDRAGEADIIVAKHRNGPVGTVTLRWIAQCLRFENPPAANVDQFFQPGLFPVNQPAA